MNGDDQLSILQQKHDINRAQLADLSKHRTAKALRDAPVIATITGLHWVMEGEAISHRIAFSIGEGVVPDGVEPDHWMACRLREVAAVLDGEVGEHFELKADRRPV